MTDENKVRIIVNGEAAEYEHWTDVSITSELNTLARSFQVGTTAKLPQSSTLLRSFKLGDEVQIYIGDDLTDTVNSTKWSATCSPGDFVDLAITKASVQFISVLKIAFCARATLLGCCRRLL